MAGKPPPPAAHELPNADSDPPRPAAIGLAIEALARLLTRTRRVCEAWDTLQRRLGKLVGPEPEGVYAWVPESVMDDKARIAFSTARDAAHPDASKPWLRYFATRDEVIVEARRCHREIANARTALAGAQDWMDRQHPRTFAFSTEQAVGILNALGSLVSEDTLFDRFDREKFERIALSVGAPLADLKAIVGSEPMQAEVPAVTVPTRIERPDFHVTTDIRATSDPLWRHLAAFRRRLMDGVKCVPAEWHDLLCDIRMAAHVAGLRPHLGTVEWIAATLKEVNEGDAGLSFDHEPDTWSKVVLTACGQAGWVQLHDLLDGFDNEGKRLLAIEWAESWMNARERQLCGTRTAGHEEAKIVPASSKRDDEAPNESKSPNRSQSTDVGNESPTYPTMQDLINAVGAEISNDTFRRVRAKARIEVRLKGWQARTRPYPPHEVDLLIAAALEGHFVEGAAMAEAWARWGSKQQVSRK